jgi:hypothetical protein
VVKDLKSNKHIEILSAKQAFHIHKKKLPDGSEIVPACDITDLIETVILSY